MKLSIVIICWNDLEVIRGCLASIFGRPPGVSFEVIVTDNGSTDGSVAFVRGAYPQVRVVENGANLGFARANNAGFRLAAGEYVLVLNPDTVVHPGALDAWIKFAERHPEAGAFGCRVVNADGTFHRPAQLFPTVWRYWVEALFLRRLGYVSRAFWSGEYIGWDGMSEREIDWQSGCCVLFRGPVLRALGGFDERFFFNFEETDLCKRVWDAGHRIVYTPAPVVTHLWGQSAKRFPVPVAIEKMRNRYRYFHKHHGLGSLAGLRRATLAHYRMRRLAYRARGLLRGADEGLAARLAMYDAIVAWNARLDPVRFVESGAEPDLGIEALPSRPASDAARAG